MADVVDLDEHRARHRRPSEPVGFREAVENAYKWAVRAKQLAPEEHKSACYAAHMVLNNYIRKQGKE